MTEEEQNYTQACMQMQRAIDQFKQHASIDAYLDAKERIIRTYLETHYPSLVFVSEPVQTTKRSHNLLEVRFFVDLHLKNGNTELTSMITQELCSYLDRLSSVESLPACKIAAEPQ